jgi:hypothetical protein
LRNRELFGYLYSKTSNAGLRTEKDRKGRRNVKKAAADAKKAAKAAADTKEALKVAVDIK